MQRLAIHNTAINILKLIARSPDRKSILVMKEQVHLRIRCGKLMKFNFRFQKFQAFSKAISLQSMLTRTVLEKSFRRLKLVHDVFHVKYS